MLLGGRSRMKSLFCNFSLRLELIAGQFTLAMCSIGRCDTAVARRDAAVTRKVQTKLLPHGRGRVVR